jgi:hypothetical protein
MKQGTENDLFCTPAVRETIVYMYAEPALFKFYPEIIMNCHNIKQRRQPP